MKIIRIFCTLFILSVESFGQSLFFTVNDSVGTMSIEGKESFTSTVSQDNWIAYKTVDFIKQSKFILRPHTNIANPEKRLITHYKVEIHAMNDTTSLLESPWMNFVTGRESVSLSFALNAISLDTGTYQAHWKLKTATEVYAPFPKSTITVASGEKLE